MADAARTHTPRADLDIHKDVISLITTYPPTTHDRHKITVTVTDGVVALHGHVLTPINRRYLINEIPRIAGVRALDSTGLFDDETIRLESGRLMPQGVFVNVRYGTVALSGAVPSGEALDTLAGSVASVPGVLRVVVGG